MDQREEGQVWETSLPERGAQVISWLWTVRKSFSGTLDLAKL